MILNVLLSIACSGGSNGEPPADPALAASDESELPMGSISAEPILPKPIVLGAIDTQAVEDAVAAVRPAIDACYEAGRVADPALAGKVLVRFVISKDGTVKRSETRSTSLRHPATEECVNARVAEARFPALPKGETAIVSYPFVFGTP